ncbi:cell division protein FtsI (penicillin-binding protein 3) [Williamsia muralis]|uniref:Cell division protein FtsI (Penicillin-binding protein 3) n=1 Tax=Williamsia marianensis TaxID=85044 RepID=A0A495K1C5_WILMA|nr:penicillin-binding protein 2 [Williamsia muralis]RKR95036.1 cell division protein FtsI (penicillin-binding protein 3) [Williamsia muralis]
MTRPTRDHDRRARQRATGRDRAGAARRPRGRQGKSGAGAREGDNVAAGRSAATRSGFPIGGSQHSNQQALRAGRQFLVRHRLASLVIVLIVAVVAIKMVMLQVVDASGLSAEAASQRAVTEVLPAKRGAIEDRNGKAIAYTDDARALTFQPVKVRKEIEEANKKTPSLPGVDERIDQIAAGISAELGSEYNQDSIKELLRSNENFVYLARAISPEAAGKIIDEFPEVGSERQDVRLYPGGSLAANIVGDVDFDGNGLIGLESSMDSILSGTDGSRTYDRGSDGAVIPGSSRNLHPSVNGGTVELTIDSDIQWYVQNEVEKAKKLSKAKNASAVVLDAKTGEVLAMANDGTFNPAKPLDEQDNAQLGDLPITSPFEPGSVNKIVTAAAAIEYGITNPTEVHQVPGSIDMADVTVKDAWAHGVEPYTTTGIFGKSSNVGTLMLADEVGEDRFADMVKRFGLGQRSDVGLPAESAGVVPARSQWSGGTFANLPIGQGLTMTLLQMTAMYQAIANDGLRIPPRIIKSIEGTGQDGQLPAPEGVQVVSPQTARTVRDMFRATIQNDPMGVQMGTGAKAEVPGYQISGKTGTAQQVDPDCGCYSQSSYNITFAGIAPADNPRYVIGIMLDAPTRSSDGTGGQSAAPLFQSIASWMLQREQVPMSAQPPPPLVLRAE